MYLFLLAQVVWLWYNVAMKTSQRAIVMFAAALSSACVHAKSCVWTGAGDGAFWSDAANWQDDAKPANGDTVTISVTPTAVSQMTNDIANLTLAEFNFSVNTQPCNLYGERLTLSGDSSMTFALASNAKNQYVYMPFHIGSGATLSVTTASGPSIQWYGEISGQGDFRKKGPRQISMLSGNGSHSGNWYLEDGIFYIYTDPTVFGTGSVHVYGQNKTAGTSASASLQIRNNLTLDNDIHIYYHTSIVSFRGVTLNGDLTFHSGNSGEEGRLHTYTETDGGKTYYGHFQLNGTVRLDPAMNAGKISLYTSSTNHWIRFAGPELDLSGRPFQWSSDGTFYFACPVRNTPTDGNYALLFVYNRKVVLERDNVFPESAYIYFGHTRTNAFGTLDLNGHSQRIGRMGFSQPDADHLAVNPALTNDSVITTSGGPATLTLTAYTGTTLLTRLEGDLSLDFESGVDPNVRYSTTFPEGFTHTMTGTIATRNFSVFYMRGNFPNLSKLEISNTGTLYFDTQSGVDAMNPNVIVDVHDLDPTSMDSSQRYTNGYISVSGGMNLNVGHVLYDEIDLPAGRYVKQVSGNPEPRWMQSGGGSLTILDHDPLWVWTGKGDGETLTDAANWATNASPATAAGRALLDFRHPVPAAGLTLDGELAIAGMRGDTNTALTVFGGTGTLTISGATANSLPARFTGGASVVYAGTGRQTFTGGRSDTAGRLSVQSGSVAFADGFDWGTNGMVSVISGAKLALAEGVHAHTADLRLDGACTKNGTWGSTASAAARTSDMFFEGPGDIENLRVPGTMLILR